MERYDYDGIMRLVGAVFELAVRDAKRGKEPALHWLESTFPDWRRYSDRSGRPNLNKGEK